MAIVIWLNCTGRCKGEDHGDSGSEYEEEEVVEEEVVIEETFQEDFGQS